MPSREGGLGVSVFEGIKLELTWPSTQAAVERRQLEGCFNVKVA